MPYPILPCGCRLSEDGRPIFFCFKHLNEYVAERIEKDSPGNPVVSENAGNPGKNKEESC